MDQTNNTINFRVPDGVDEAINQVDPEKRAKLKRREEWGALPPKYKHSMKPPVDKVLLTSTNTSPCSSEWECIQTIRELQQAHMARGEPDIKHHFLVGGDGMIYEGRGYTTAGPEYPMSSKDLSKLSKLSIDVGIIGTMSELNKKQVIKAVADVATNCQYNKVITPKFDLVWVENGEILHIVPATGKMTLPGLE